MTTSSHPTSGHVPVIGVVGGIGSGKSSVARRLGELISVVVIDADVVGHQVLKETATKAALRAEFGDGIFHNNGEIDRPALGRLVFGRNQESSSAKKALEKIVHPRIGEILGEQIAAAQATPGVQAVILDAAVLLETGWKDHCDAIVFVDAPAETRRQRVMDNRNWTAEEFADREANQLPLPTKKELSDQIVDNAQSVDRAAEQLRQFVMTIAGRPAKK